VGFESKNMAPWTGFFCEYVGCFLCLIIQALLLINRTVIRRTDFVRFTSSSFRRHATARIKLKRLVLVM
jgi:hypothetical protein